MIGKGTCSIEFIWNPRNFDCGCDKLYDVGEYLDYEKGKFRKKLTDELAEEWNKNIDWNGMIYNNYGNVCHSCTI